MMLKLQIEPNGVGSLYLAKSNRTSEIDTTYSLKMSNKHVCV